ncbi:hypothetical protein ACLKA7_011871 [Drosophila subpalustris]
MFVRPGVAISLPVASCLRIGGGGGGGSVNCTVGCLYFHDANNASSCLRSQPNVTFEKPKPVENYSLSGPRWQRSATKAALRQQKSSQQAINSTTADDDDAEDDAGNNNNNNNNDAGPTTLIESYRFGVVRVLDVLV